MRITNIHKKQCAYFLHNSVYFVGGYLNNIYFIFFDFKQAFRCLEYDIVTDEHRKIFRIVSYQFDLPEDEVEKFSLKSPKVRICLYIDTI